MIEKAQQANKVEALLLTEFGKIHPEMHATFVAMASDWAKRWPAEAEPRRQLLRLVQNS